MYFYFYKPGFLVLCYFNICIFIIIKYNVLDIIKYNAKYIKIVL